MTRHDDHAEVRCPLDDCTWIRRYTRDTAGDAQLTGTLAAAGGRNLAVERARLAWLEGIERDLEDHLGRHPLVDFVTAITEQRTALVRSEDVTTELRRQVAAFDRHMEREHPRPALRTVPGS